jgi:hypothetical protein
MRVGNYDTLGGAQLSPFANGELCTLTIAVMNLCGKTKQSTYAGVLRSFHVMMFTANRRAAAIVYQIYPRQVSVQCLKTAIIARILLMELLPRSYSFEAPLPWLRWLRFRWMPSMVNVSRRSGMLLYLNRSLFQ